MTAREPVERRPFTELERERALALYQATMYPGTASKRFARNLAYSVDIGITDKQAAYLERLCWTFRRQLPPALVPPEKP